MDLGFITKRLAPVGGTERDLRCLVERLTGFGHQVSIYCSAVDDGPVPGVEVVRVPTIGFGRLARMWSIAERGPRLAYGGGHDLVIGFTRVLRQDVIRCGGGTHKGYLRTLSESGGGVRGRVRSLRAQHRSMLAIERRQFRGGQYRKVLAISDVVRRDIVHNYDVPASDVAVIYDGVDTARFHTGLMESHRSEVREEFGVPGDTSLILFLGHGFRRKGLETLIAAMRLVRDRGSMCMVVGGDPDIERYRRRAAEAGLARRIIFAGKQPDPERFYGCADILALPAIQEGFGNVVLEALASGLPAAVSARAGAAEMLREDMPEGVIADPLDPECVAHVLDVLSSAGSSSRRERARRIAEQHTLDRNAREIEELLLGLVRKKRTA